MAEDIMAIGDTAYKIYKNGLASVLEADINRMLKVAGKISNEDPKVKVPRNVVMNITCFVETHQIGAERWQAESVQHPDIQLRTFPIVTLDDRPKSEAEKHIFVHDRESRVLNARGLIEMLVDKCFDSKTGGTHAPATHALLVKPETREYGFVSFNQLAQALQEDIDKSPKPKIQPRSPVAAANMIRHLNNPFPAYSALADFVHSTTQQIRQETGTNVSLGVNGIGRDNSLF